MCIFNYGGVKSVRTFELEPFSTPSVWDCQPLSSRPAYERDATTALEATEAFVSGRPQLTPTGTGRGTTRDRRELIGGRTALDRTYARHRHRTLEAELT